MKLSQAGKDLIKSFEGLELRVYPDPATGGAPYTAGYGHTGSDVKPGMKVTQAMADAWFDKDVQKFEEGVSALLKVTTAQAQFDAMVSLAYNIGLGNFSKSTLLKKHNAKCWSCAAGQFLVWNKAAGKVMNGLIRRRNAERAMYLGQ